MGFGSLMVWLTRRGVLFYIFFAYTCRLLATCSFSLVLSCFVKIPVEGSVYIYRAFVAEIDNPSS